MKPLALFLLAASCCAQTAIFPGGVVTDAQLGTASNNVQTLISQSMGSTDTTLKVLSAVGIAANQIATIDAENVWVCGVAGQTVSVGRSSCPNVDGRGFDGTSAVAHSAVAANCYFGTSSGCVTEFVTAWHNNAKNKEIEAIEGATPPGISGLAYASFSSACTSATGNGLPLLPVKTWTAVPSQTCSAPINFYSGGVIQPAAGQTITITGKVTAPPTMIFDLSLGGQVVLNGSAVGASPQWWSNFGTRAVYSPSTLHNGLPGLLSAIASIKFGNATPAVIAMFGDSWTAGQYYTTGFTRRLQQGLGGAGQGYVMMDGVDGPPAGASLATTGAWSNALSIYSPYTDSTSSSDTSTPANKAVTCTATNFVLGYQGGFGTFRYNVDGGSWTSVATAGQSGNQFVTISGLSFANHTLNVQPLSGSAVPLFGTDCQVASVAGVRTEVFAKSGQTAQYFSTLDQTALTATLGQAAPNLITVMLGINDWQIGAETAPQFQGYLQTFVSKLQAAYPAANIVLMTQADSGYSNPSTYVPFVLAIQSVALQNNLTFIDLWDLFGPFAFNGTTNAFGLFNGGLHPSSLGGTSIAETLLSYLPGMVENPTLRGNLAGLAGQGGLAVPGTNCATGPTTQGVCLNGQVNPDVTVTDTDGTITKVQSAGGAGYIGTQTNGQLNLVTNNVTRGVLDTSGNLTITGAVSTGGSVLATQSGRSASMSVSANPDFFVSDGTNIAKLQVSTSGGLIFGGSQSAQVACWGANNITTVGFCVDATGLKPYIPGLPNYANNAAAIAAGLNVVGMLYRITGTDTLGIVH